MTIWGRIGRSWIVLGLIVGAATQASSQERGVQDSKAPTTADALIQEALRLRTLGQGDPAAVLARALAADPRSKPAHWQSGYVFEAGNWTKYDAVADIDSHRQSLLRYENERNAHGETLEGHVALAEWCRVQKLEMQERAHWFKVLQFDPEHSKARSRLGFGRFAGQWIDRAEMENILRHKRETELAFKKWSAALRPIRIGFESNDPVRVAAARRKLAEIRDPASIPAMEATLSGVSIDAASAVVQTIRRMPGPDAAVGLARLAVFAEWFPTGEEAAQALRSYDELSYMPAMLSALATPGKSLRVTYLGGGFGRLLVRYEFERERQDRTEKLTRDVGFGVWVRTANNTDVVPAWDLPPGETLTRTDGRDPRPYYQALLNTQVEADQAWVHHRLEEEARSVRQLNAQLCRALRAATSAVVPAPASDDPNTWWNWWENRRDIVASRKPVVLTQFVDESNRFYPELEYFRKSCLVAGTPVYTEIGPRPIEQIRLGDRVLSQNVDTGELAFRSVLTPTKRESAPTVVLTLRGNERSPNETTIRCSPGHPFWAVGRGWLMAKEFKPGMRLAAVGGTVEVAGVESGAEAAVYNLVVDEFHSYFVGETLVLSHDVQPPESARGGLPGEITAR